MRILEKHQNWLLPGEILDLIKQRRERLMPLLRRRQGERRIPMAERDRQHRGDQRGDLVHPVSGQPERLLQLFELGDRVLLRRDARRALELLDEGVERTVPMIGRALVAQLRMRRICDLIGQPGGNARFANARLAEDQHGLALACPGAALVGDELAALGFAPYEPYEPRWMRRLETALAFRNAERRPGLDRLGEALDDVLPEIAQAKPVAEQPARRHRDHDAARVGQALQPRGEVGRVADHRLLLSGALSHEIADHDEAGRDADPRGEFLTRAGLQTRHSFGDFESYVHRARRIVFVRVWKAEIGENAVAEKSRDEAVVSHHYART